MDCNFRFSRTLLAGAVFMLAGSAMAATLEGGGATLPGIAYSGAAASTVTSSVLGTGANGSLFDAYTTVTSGNPTVSYCQTGSGTGKGVLIGTKLASDPCPASGFAASTADGNFVGSDSPLAQSEATTFNTNKGSTRVNPVQVPSIAGSIALVFSLKDSSGSPITSMDLSRAQICNIFSSAYTTWNQVNSSYPSTAIRIVYRSSGSGTTYGFGNFLSKTCNSGTTPTFYTEQLYYDATAGIIHGSAPSNAIGAANNQGVVTAVGANDGAIGYAEAANSTSGVSVATVETLAPKSALPGTTSFTLTNLLTSRAITGSNATTGRPVVSALTTTNNCVRLVDPDAYAGPGATGSLGGVYPIKAVTYLLGYNAANGTSLTNTRALLKAPYTSAVTARTNTIGSGTGYSYLSFTGLGTQPTTTVDNCIN